MFESCNKVSNKPKGGINVYKFIYSFIILNFILHFNFFKDLFQHLCATYMPKAPVIDLCVWPSKHAQCYQGKKKAQIWMQVWQAWVCKHEYGRRGTNMCEHVSMLVTNMALSIIPKAVFGWPESWGGMRMLFSVAIIPPFGHGKNENLIPSLSFQWNTFKWNRIPMLRRNLILPLSPGYLILDYCIIQ